MLPRLKCRAARAAHILVHVELLTTLFHRICSPAVQTPATVIIDRKESASSSSSTSSSAASTDTTAALHTQIATFCNLVHATLLWLLHETQWDFRATLLKHTERDTRLFQLAEQMCASPAIFDSIGNATPMSFVNTVCVPSGLRCIDQSIIKISSEHQEKLMQLVVQQVKAIICHMDPAIAHVSMTDVVLCRVSALASQVNLLQKHNRNVSLLTKGAIEALAALTGYVKSEEFSTYHLGPMVDLQQSGEQDRFEAWALDLRRLTKLFHGFGVRVSLLADLGLHDYANEQLPYIVSAPGIKGAPRAAAMSTMATVSASDAQAPAVSASSSSAASATPSVISATSPATLTSVGVSPADIERITFDAFKVLSCLVRAKRASSYSSFSSSSLPPADKEIFTYEALKQFLSTDFVLLRPIAVHLAQQQQQPSRHNSSSAEAAAVAVSPTGSATAMSSRANVAGAGPAAATKKAEVETQMAGSATAVVAHATAPQFKEDEKKPQQQPQPLVKASGDFLLALMDD